MSASVCKHKLYVLKYMYSRWEGGRRQGKERGGKTGREERWGGRKEERGEKGTKGWRKEREGNSQCTTEMQTIAERKS